MEVRSILRKNKMPRWVPGQPSTIAMMPPTVMVTTILSGPFRPHSGGDKLDCIYDTSLSWLPSWLFKQFFFVLCHLWTRATYDAADCTFFTTCTVSIVCTYICNRLCRAEPSRSGTNMQRCKQNAAVPRRHPQLRRNYDFIFFLALIMTK